MHPTDALYASLKAAYGHFNQALFEGMLPDIIFTVQRQRGLLGYFAPDRWSSLDGQQCHEIAINPAHMGDSRLIDVLQTLVHEMVHCWQYCYGMKVPRSNYHNKEWARKMKEVGLQPTATGLPGGAEIGQEMSDYPIPDGRFLRSCYALLEQELFNFPWIDRRITPKSAILETAAQLAEPIQTENIPVVPIQTDIEDGTHDDIPDRAWALEDIERQLFQPYADCLPEKTLIPYQPVVKKPRQKYQCPGCRVNVWGRPGLYLICGDCSETFEPSGQ